MDYAYLNYSVHSEEFRALVSKYDLVNDPDIIIAVDKIVEILYDLNAKCE